MIAASAPARVCLSGEDLDWLGFRSLCVAVDMPTTATIVAAPQSIHTEDSMSAEAIADSLWLFLRDSLPGLPAARQHLSVTTSAPIGGGLSSSTALIIAMIRVFLGQCVTPSHSDLDIARLAYEFEFMTCQGGGMDQLAIALGSMVLTEGQDGRLPNVIGRTGFPEHWVLVVVDSGVRKSTARHIRTLRQRIAAGDRRIGEYCQQVDAATVAMWNAIQDERLADVWALMRQTHAAMRDLQEMSTDQLEDLRTLMDDVTGLPLKVCGAGGGGSLVGVAGRSDARAMVEEYNRVLATVGSRAVAVTVDAA